MTSHSDRQCQAPGRYADAGMDCHTSEIHVSRLQQMRPRHSLKYRRNRSRGLPTCCKLSNHSNRPSVVTHGRGASCRQRSKHLTISSEGLRCVLALWFSTFELIRREERADRSLRCVSWQMAAKTALFASFFAFLSRCEPPAPPRRWFIEFEARTD